jgi:hypothetical protein
MRGRNIYISKRELEAILECTSLLNELVDYADDIEMYDGVKNALYSIINKAKKATRKEVVDYLLNGQKR